MVTHPAVRNPDPKGLFLDRMPGPTRRSFLFAATLPLFLKPQWYLAGGTALALQVGHRQSVDLDFFTPQPKINETALERVLLATGQWQTTYRQAGTIYGLLYGAKVSFIAYPFFMPAAKRLRYGTLTILAPSDIAAMKIIAVSQRGRKRDFVDLYWYCLNREALASVLRRAMAQYPGQEHNLPHILKSLTYFTDAEADPMPKLFFKASWPGIKAYFRREVPAVARILLKIA